MRYGDFLCVIAMFPIKFGLMTRYGAIMTLIGLKQFLGEIRHCIMIRIKIELKIRVIGLI